MNCRLCGKLHNRVKKFYCLFFSCFRVTNKIGVFLPCLAYLETQFGIFCVSGLGNTGRSRFSLVCSSCLQTDGLWLPAIMTEPLSFCVTL